MLRRIVSVGSLALALTVISTRRDAAVGGSSPEAKAHCSPTGTTRAVDVSFGGASNVAAIAVVLAYPGDKVSIPGRGGDQSVSNRISNTPSGSLAQSNDVDTALIEGIISMSAMPAGRIFTVTFDVCAESAVPTAAEFPCRVKEATDRNGAAVSGVRCSAMLL